MISGRGSNMEVLAAAAAAKDFPAEIVGIASDTENAPGLEIAEKHGLPALAIPAPGGSISADQERELEKVLKDWDADLICLAGYMRILSSDFVKRWSGRMINIHPSLLPLFPGLHTHRRALAAGVLVHGCTVHFVTAGVDEGPVIAQAVVPVRPGEDEEALTGRVLRAEHTLYPHALKLVAGGTARMSDDGKRTVFGEVMYRESERLVVPPIDG